MTINEIKNQAHDNAVKRFFYGDNQKDDVSSKLLEELNEFIDAVPRDEFHKDSEQSEISDMIIVLLAYSGYKGYDIDSSIADKLAFNRTREDHQLEIF